MEYNSTLDGGADRNALVAIIQYLRKHKLTDSENLLRKETNFYDVINEDNDAQSIVNDVSSVWSAYKNENDPATYYDMYQNLIKFVEGALDIYKHEIGMVLYPVFLHMYLELVYNGHGETAKAFIERFGLDQEDYYAEDIAKLACVTKREQMRGNDFMENLKSSQFTVRMSRDSYNFLKKYLDEKKLIQNIIQEHLYLDVYEGLPRNKHQIDATAGAMCGEAERLANKTKVYYGLLKEPDIQIPVEEDEEVPEAESDKPKKKKSKKDPLLSKKSKNDPNAPSNHRLPLPELRDIDKVERIRALRESSKRITIGPDALPSICFYTFLNCHESVTCIEVSEDSSILAAGFSDSTIKVWSLVPQKLKSMKSAEDLSDIDKEADDVLARMLDEKSAETWKCLYGHSGPVYSTNISSDRTLLLSCSEDSTIRLWSLQIWACLVCYKGHLFPVWYTQFSPHGYYFASCGHDKTARLWVTDHHQPVRLFVGHLSDVDCLQFHPNSNYLATGSSDRSVRIWDCVTGQCVRIMTGHKGTVRTLTFSVEGRFLASGGADAKILLWDLSHGHLLADLSSHCESISCLAFSRDGNILASGSLDCSVKLWDFTKLTEEMNLEDVNVSHNPDVKHNSDNYLLGTYPTKCTPVLEVHFTRRNLLLASGMFIPPPPSQ